MGLALLEFVETNAKHAGDQFQLAVELAVLAGPDVGRNRFRGLVGQLTVGTHPQYECRRKTFLVRRCGIGRRTWLAVDASDRPRLLEDIGRTFGEHGCNVVEYSGSTSDGMARNRYAVEIGDVKTLRSVLSALRAIDSVWDAYRITPRTAA